MRTDRSDVSWNMWVQRGGLVVVVLSVLVSGWVACLPTNGSGGGDGFVDSSSLDELGEGFNAEEGGVCRSSMDCSGDLRCARVEGVQFCTEPCTSDSTCGTNQCNFFEDGQGWCSLSDDGSTSGGGNGTSGGTSGGGTTTGGGTSGGTSTGGGTTGGGTSGGGLCSEPLVARQVEVLNEDRVREGLQPVVCHEGLSAVALAHSEDMAVRDYFDHESPDGDGPSDRVNRAGITNWTMLGENIALGYPTPEDVQEGWMNSPGHRANILTEEFDSVGVGVYDSNGQLYWTQVFARF